MRKIRAVKTTSFDFAKWLRSLMRGRNLSCEEMGRETSIPASTIKGWVQGRTMIPLDRAVRIADHFGYKMIFIKKTSPILKMFEEEENAGRESK